MKKQTLLTVIALLILPMASYAGSHTAGNNNANQSCFYDSKPGRGKWHYYFCGEQGNKCAGKKAGGLNWFEQEIMGKGKNDSKLVLKDMEVFTFLTDPKDSYCCCGGTSTKAGSFVKAENALNCYKNEAPQETMKDLGGGKACKVLTYTTVCGTKVTIDCDTPTDDICKEGQIWRTNRCAPICSGDQVYSSEKSDECITCNTTSHQGISADGEYCVKCDTVIEFFDRETKTCVKKNSVKVKKYSKDAMHTCWRCPQELFKKCVEAVSEVNEQALTGQTRLTRINELGGVDLVKYCELK